MSDHYSDYKKVADEYYSLYMAFISSGFSEEQAFKLIKAQCTSVAVQNMLEGLRHARERYNSADKLRETLRKRAEKKECGTDA
jgi:hypothetical protein